MDCPTSRFRCWLVVWLWGALFYVHQQRFDAPTPFARLASLHAVVQERTLAIDRWHQRTPDKAFHDGHYYSDKAPGTAALALPAFATAAAVLSRAGVDLDSPTGWRITSWAACAFSQALPAALGAAAFFAWLGRFVSPRAALVTVVGLTLGSQPLPYSTLLFSHAQVIGLIGLAIWAMKLFVPEVEDGRLDSGQCEPNAVGRPAASATKPGRMALVGFCLGLALASEFTAGIVVVVLGAYGVFRARRVGAQRSLRWFFWGALPPLLLIPAYSWATISTPWDLPYSYQASFPAMREGLYAIKWPDVENLGRLLFGPARGLVFWTPFLVMAGFGWWWITRERPRWLWLTYAVPVLHALVISGRTWDWKAGSAISARYLAPLLPLLALPCALGVQRWPRLGVALAMLSVGLMSVATVTDASPPYHLDNPLVQIHLPMLLQGKFSHTLGTALFGLPPAWGVALYYVYLAGGLVWLWRQTAPHRPSPASHPDAHEPA